MTNPKRCHAETPEGGTQYLKCAIYYSAQYIELIETGADKFAGPIAKIIAKENVLALVGK